MGRSAPLSRESGWSDSSPKTLLHSWAERVYRLSLTQSESLRKKDLDLAPYSDCVGLLGKGLIDNPFNVNPFGNVFT